MTHVGTPVKIESLRRQVNELGVLNSELASLKPNVKVYEQHGSGKVLFLANGANIVNKYKGILNDAKQRLEKVEKEQISHNNK